MCIVHFTYIFTGQYAMVYMIESRLLFTHCTCTRLPLNYCKPTFVHENFVLRFTEDKLVSND